MTVFSIIPTDKPNKRCAELLREMADEADKGNVSAVCIVAVTPDGYVDWRISDLPNSMTMLGAIDRAKARILRAFDGN